MIMMQVLVDDLDAWWRHIESLDLVATLASRVRGRPPCSHGDPGSPVSSILPECCGKSRSVGKVTRRTNRGQDLTLTAPDPI